MDFAKSPVVAWIFRQRCGTLVQTAGEAKGKIAMSRTKRSTVTHIGLALFAYLLFPVGDSGRALAVENPAAWVESIYADYAGNKTAVAPLAILKPEASPRLKRLIESEDACLARNKGLCRIDFDPIVNAQDFEITDVLVKSHAKVGTKGPGLGLVTATFKNGGRSNIIEYTFIQQGARWLLDDIAAKTPGEEKWTLSKILGAGNP